MPAEAPKVDDAEPSRPKRLDRVEIELPDGRRLLLYNRRPRDSEAP